jgi:serine/threonine protein kinase
MVVYELFTGQSPNAGELTDPLKFAHRAAHEGYRPPLPSTLPPYIRSLITRCWAHNPDDRPNFQMLLNELMSNANQRESDQKPQTASSNENRHQNTSSKSEEQNNSHYYVS